MSHIQISNLLRGFSSDFLCSRQKDEWTRLSVRFALRESLIDSISNLTFRLAPAPLESNKWELLYPDWRQVYWNAPLNADRIVGMGGAEVWGGVGHLSCCPVISQQRWQQNGGQHTPAVNSSSPHFYLSLNSESHGGEGVGSHIYRYIMCVRVCVLLSMWANQKQDVLLLSLCSTHSRWKNDHENEDRK